jgi:hypothetical protein
MRRRLASLLLVFGCQLSASAFRQPEPRTAPLGFYDIRTQGTAPSESEQATIHAEVRTGLAALEKHGAAHSLSPAASTAIQVRLHPATSRPRNLFSLLSPLSDASAKPPAEIARDFLSTHSAIFGLSSKEIAEMTALDEYRHTEGKSRHLVLQQRCANLDVFQARIQFALDNDGRVIQVAGNYHPGLRVAGQAQLSAIEAIQWAAAHCDRTHRRSDGPIAPRTELQLSALSPGQIAAQNNQQFALYESPVFRDSISPRLVIMPVCDQGVPAWEMTLHLNGQECYYVLVDARNGSLLYRTNLYKFAETHCGRQEAFGGGAGSVPASTDNQDAHTMRPPKIILPAGLVFTKSPDAGAREEVLFVGDPTASPAGWCDGTSTTQGNNVVAREDADGNDEKVPGAQPFQPDRQFLFPFINSWADNHTTGPDVNAVVTNLFYFCNQFHDYVYGLGFNEVSGNFQLDNFGRGGLGNDRIYADAMDGSGFNNANFVTLPDGDPPRPYAKHSRLQVFLFKPVPPIYPFYRDGDLDGEVVMHECTHGMTTRMVGGPSNIQALETLQAGAMGEGWSDFFPCSFYNDPVFGEYVSGNAVRGARHAPYDAHPWKFGSLGRTFELTSPTLPAGGPLPSVFVPESHADGEIWAAALWALRTELGTARLAEQLVVEALRYTPVAPNMLDGRDAILLADAIRFQGTHHARIWRAFARRGMGWSAEVEEGANAALVFQAFDWPPALGGSFTTGLLVLSDNMESSPGVWSVKRLSPGGQVAFHLTKHRSASGSVSWYFGLEDAWSYNTGSREASWLESPPFTLPTGSGYVLEFKHWRKAEDSIDWNEPPPYYFDPGIVYVHVAGASEYYDMGFSFNNTLGWETRHIDLSEFAGRTIQIGFYFDTWDQKNNNFEGWYIDDVKVFRSQTTNIPPTAADPIWNTYR